MVATATAVTFDQRALQCKTPKQNASVASLTMTATTDTMLYRISFLPSGDRARSSSAEGVTCIGPIVPIAPCRTHIMRSVGASRCHFPRSTDTSAGSEGVDLGDAAQPRRRRLRSAAERRSVDGDQAERRAIAKRPFEIVERAPVHVAAHVDPVVETAGHTSQRPLHVLDAAGVIGGGDAVLGHHDRDAVGDLPRPPDTRFER